MGAWARSEEAQTPHTGGQGRPLQFGGPTVISFSQNDSYRPHGRAQSGTSSVLGTGPGPALSSYLVLTPASRDAALKPLPDVTGPSS